LVVANVQLTLASQTFAAGKADLDAEAYGAAFIKFQEAIRIAQQAQAEASSAHVLNVKLDLGQHATSTGGSSATVYSSTTVQTGSSTKIKTEGNVELKIGL